MNIITIVITILILAIVLAFLLHRYLIDISAILVNILFPIFVIVALLALFVPSLFNSATEFVVSSSPFAEQLKSIDTSLNQASNVPNSILKSIQNLFNPNANQSKNEFKSELYPNFINMVSEILRWSTLVFSLLIMIIFIYFKYSTASVLRIRELERKYEELEKKISNSVNH